MLEKMSTRIYDVNKLDAEKLQSYFQIKCITRPHTSGLMLNLSAVGCDYCFLIGKYQYGSERLPITGICLSNTILVFKSQKSLLHLNQKRVWGHPEKFIKTNPCNFVNCFQMVHFRIADHKLNDFGRIRHLTMLKKLSLGLVGHGTKYHKNINRIMTIT